MAYNPPRVGQRFRDISMRVQNSDWLVVAIYRASIGVEHAMLRSILDPSAQKTLSLSVLADSSKFSLVETVT
jgi:hypothetical protein